MSHRSTSGPSDATVGLDGVVQRSGREVPVYVEVTRVEDGEDFVVALGVYPQETADEVRPEVTALFEGIEH